jgi:hypothetical protein
MVDAGKPVPVSRWKRWLSFAVVPILAGLGLAVAAQPAQAASTYNCPNADNHTPPFNWTDRCVVFSFDKGTEFVANLTGAAICDFSSTRSHSQRIRVVADYQPGKLLIRSIDIRYVSGIPKWAYYNVQVEDGNGQYFKRAWNNNENVIDWDGASDVVENTVHITPTPGFAPVFGAGGIINVMITPHFTNYPQWLGGINQVCAGDRVVEQFVFGG